MMDLLTLEAIFDPYVKRKSGAASGYSPDTL